MKQSNNPYANVIHLLENHNLDYKALCYEIAATAPTVVLKAHKTLAGKVAAANEPSYLREIRALLMDPHSNNYIAAIKHYRMHTSAGLKEAKDFIDNFREKIGAPRR